MGYRVRKIDSNQPAITKKFRDLGCSVAILSSVGNGLPDLLISKWIGRESGQPQRWTALIEIKDGSKPPSGRKLTPDEAAFHYAWQGELFIIESEKQAEDLINSLLP
jgi:hypothetical protein